jgi:hypothetical protein
MKVNKDCNSNNNTSAFGSEGDDYEGEKPCLDGQKIPWEQFKNLSKMDKDLVMKWRKQDHEQVEQTPSESNGRKQSILRW